MIQTNMHHNLLIVHLSNLQRVSVSLKSPSLRSFFIELPSLRLGILVALLLQDKQVN